MQLRIMKTSGGSKSGQIEKQRHKSQNKGKVTHDNLKDGREKGSVGHYQCLSRDGRNNFPSLEEGGLSATTQKFARLHASRLESI